jgi:flagellar hook-basal body complex protein FliE
MIDLNANIASIQPKPLQSAPSAGSAQQVNGENFSKIIDKCLSNVDKQQQNSDALIQDFISGKNQDINSVVSEVAKADMSFKLLVGVRNKIIEAYKQMMQMQI